MTNAEIAAAQDSFVQMATKLRALGATKVSVVASAVALVAEFAPEAPYQTQPSVTVVPIGGPSAREHALRVAKEKADYALYEGEKLTAEDKERRAGYADLRELVTGEGT